VQTQPHTAYSPRNTLAPHSPPPANQQPTSRPTLTTHPPYPPYRTDTSLTLVFYPTHRPSPSVRPCTRNATGNTRTATHTRTSRPRSTPRCLFRRRCEVFARHAVWILSRVSFHPTGGAGRKRREGDVLGLSGGALWGGCGILLGRAGCRDGAEEGEGRFGTVSWSRSRWVFVLATW
jgi:hypothetical protein